MAAGDKLAAAALKIAQKVPGSDKAVTLMVDAVGEWDPTYEERPVPLPSEVVSFGQACEVRNMSVQKATALLGDYEAGDREFLLPAASVTEEQLRAAGTWIRYGDEGAVGTDELDIKRIDPHEINFGVVATWRVVGRVRGKAVDS